jgi:hypothetical protein
VTAAGADAVELVKSGIPTVVVTYADGHQETSGEGAYLGAHSVIVSEDLVNNLISSLAMLDAGGTLALHRGGGAIRNADGSSRIPILRGRL